MANTRRIDAELNKLDETPIGQKISSIDKRFSAALGQVRDAQNQLENEWADLKDSEDYKQYEKKREALAKQRDDAWSIERRKMADAENKLYSARHDELKQIALQDTPHARQLGLDVLTFPRMDGSLSAYPLSVILACRVLNCSYQWIYPEPTGSPWAPRLKLPEELFFFDPYEDLYRAPNLEFSLAASRVVAKPSRPAQERLAVMINRLLAISTSTHDAYSNLITGKCDLNLQARAPSEDELQLAKRAGVKIELEPIARDALVFIVNHTNSVKSLTREQIVEIYQDKLTNWARVGGDNNGIFAFWRERNSGSRELFDSLVAAGHSIPEPKFHSVLFADSMAGPYNQVTQTPGGIAYSVFYYEHYMALSAYTRVVAIDGVEPNAKTIASGQYPWTAPVYAAYREGERADSPAMKLLHWLLSPEGQAVVRESGYVPLK
jgi:phosphate transport system substrate-binding protein